MLALICQQNNPLEKFRELATALSSTLSSTSEQVDGTANAGSSSQPIRKNRFSFGWEYIAICLVILLIAGIRFRLRDYPLERDEGEYAYAGQLILQGIPPYQVAYNMKLPGTYVAYASIMAVFGETPTGIHVGVMLVNAGCIFLLFLITKELFDSTAAVVAGATFGLFSIRPALLGLAGHATHFVALAALAAILVLLKARGTAQYRLFFWSGLLSGLAFLMKQPGVFFAIFGALYICWTEWPRTGPQAPFWRKLCYFSTGVVLPYAATCLILIRAGVFHRFWFWTVSYARAYGSELSARRGMLHFANGMLFQRENVFLIWLLIVAGMAAFLWNRQFQPHAPFILGLLGFSFLAVSAGIIYRPHYFIVIYPVLAILAGVGVSSLAHLLQRPNLPRVSRVLPAVLFSLAFANALYAERRVYFTEPADKVAREIYGDVPFPEARVIGKFIRDNSRRSDLVAVLGSEPEILFYANRVSATGYMYTYPFMENQIYASTMKSEYARELVSAKPELLVSVMISGSWISPMDNLDIGLMAWTDGYIKEHYSLIGIADGGNRDVFRWGAEAASYRPRRPSVILIYRRKP